MITQEEEEGAAPPILAPENGRDEKTSSRRVHASSLKQELPSDGRGNREGKWVSRLT